MRLFILSFVSTYFIWGVTFWQLWPFTVENVRIIGVWPPENRLLAIGVLILSQIANELIAMRLDREQ